MSAYDMLTALLANTDQGYLDHRFGTDIDQEQIVELILGTRLREAADELEAIDPIEFALGTIDPITELRRMALGNQKPAPTAYAATRGEPGEGQ